MRWFFNRGKNESENDPVTADVTAGAEPTTQEAPAASEPAAPAPPEPGTAPTSDTPSDPPPGGEKSPAAAAVEQEVIEVLRTCFDPEIPVNIYDLGLIYGIDVDSEKNVVIRMTLTSPMCPVAGSLPPEVQMKVATLADVKSADVQVVWDPPWNMSLMSEAAKLQLGFY